MARSKLASASESLAALYGKHRQHLPVYMWEDEGDRWRELLISGLIAGGGVDLATARRAVHVLDELGVLSVGTLRRTGPEAKKFIATVFHQLGVRRAAAVAASRLVCALATSVHRRWDGHVQRLLRMFAGPMTREVVRLFEGTGLTARKSRKAAVLWLQNAADMPLLLTDDRHVQAFLAQHSLSERDLITLADTAGLNLAVLDDLLYMEHEGGKTPTKRSSGGMTTRQSAKGVPAAT